MTEQLQESDIVERLREWEADREFHEAQAAKIRRLEDRCRDIRAATIEECAQVFAGMHATQLIEVWIVRQRIRALKEQK